MYRPLRNCLALVLIAACSREPSSAPASFADRVAPSPVAATAPASLGASSPAGPARRAISAGAQAEEPASEYARKVVRDLDLTLEIESLDGFLIEVQRIADQAGGYVAEADVPQQSGGSARAGTVMLRVPSDRLDGAAERFDSLGRVESRSLRSQDITDQFYDGAARLANQRHYETRLLKLIETHTGRLDDLLALEGQIAAVRENIERLEGQQRLWAHQAELATIRLRFHVHQPQTSPAKTARTFTSRLQSSLERSLALLRRCAETTAVVAVALAPWLAIVLAAAVGRMLWRKRPAAQLPNPG